MNNEITEYTDADGFTITNLGYPNFTDLAKTEKRALLLPLVELVRGYYDNPDNRRKFELWKAERKLLNAD